MRHWSVQSESRRFEDFFVGARKWPVFCRYPSLSFRTCVPFGRSTAPPGSPRSKRALVPVRFRKGPFAVDGSRVRLGVARGAPELWVRLGRAVPYPVGSLRSVTLVAEAGRLFLDVTAEVPVAGGGLDPA